MLDDRELAAQRRGHPSRRRLADAASLADGGVRPAGSFGWRVKRVGEVEPGLLYLCVGQLDNADDIDRPLAIVDKTFRDPNRWPAHDAPPADTWWPGHFGVHAHDVAGTDEPLAGLRPLIDRIVGNERADGVKIPSFPGGEELRSSVTCHLI